MENSEPPSRSFVVPLSEFPNRQANSEDERNGESNASVPQSRWLDLSSLQMPSSSQEGGRMALIARMVSSADQHNKTSASRTSSLASVSVKRTLSLPLISVADADAIASKESHVVDLSSIGQKEVRKYMARSFSAPLNGKSNLQQMDTLGQVLTIAASPCRAPANGDIKNDSIDSAVEGAGVDNFEEKPVCRICLIELGEGGETLKMGCHCKGELALAHKECAVQWFSIKGDKTCDICKQDVQNLPLTSLKMHNGRTVSRLPPDALQQHQVVYYRVWQDVPVLILVSMLAYFCLLEQLLGSEMGAHALALALPLSCVLGLLSSMIASIAVSRSHIWAYAFIQFAIVIMFAHIMYNVLRVTPVLAVLLSALIGFGITVSANSFIMEYLSWSTRRILGSARRQNVTVGQRRDNLETENGEGFRQQETQRDAQFTNVAQPR